MLYGEPPPPSCATQQGYPHDDSSCAAQDYPHMYGRPASFGAHEGACGVGSPACGQAQPAAVVPRMRPKSPPVIEAPRDGARGAAERGAETEEEARLREAEEEVRLKRECLRSQCSALEAKLSSMDDALRRV